MPNNYAVGSTNYRKNIRNSSKTAAEAEKLIIDKETLLNSHRRTNVELAIDYRKHASFNELFYRLTRNFLTIAAIAILVISYSFLTKTALPFFSSSVYSTLFGTLIGSGFCALSMNFIFRQVESSKKAKFEKHTQDLENLKQQILPEIAKIKALQDQEIIRTNNEEKQKIENDIKLVKAVGVETLHIMLSNKIADNQPFDLNYLILFI